MMPQISRLLILVQDIFAFLGAFLYLIFALVVVKQVTSMSKNVYDKFNSILILFSYLHLIFSLILLLATFLILFF